MQFKQLYYYLALNIILTVHSFTHALNPKIIIPDGYFEQKSLIHNFVQIIPGSKKISSFNPQFLLNIDFEVSLGKNYNTDFYQFLNSEVEVEKFNLFKQLFEKNNPSLMHYRQEPIIPHIIHQIWLGGNPPAQFKELQETIFEHHPGWYYKLWTDADVKKLKLINQSYFDATRNLAQKSDILRYELLYLFGGVYLDWDMSAHKSLEPLHHMYDFYAGIPGAGYNLWVCNAIIGSVPQHPIIQHAIETIPEDAGFKDVCYATGPIHFTKSFQTIAQDVQDKIIAMPTNFFYPGLPPCVVNLTKAEAEQYVRQETFIIHYWAATWLKGKR